MKRNNIKSAKGFTLVEMLGVLAIIAILVSVVSVGVMSAIKSARITGTVANLKNYETALAAHIAFNEGNGFMPLTKGALGDVPDKNAAAGLTVANQAYVHVGQVLLASGAFDSLPTWRVGKETLAGGRDNAIWDIDAAGFDVSVGAANLSDWTDRIRAECVLSGDPTGGVSDIDEGSNLATFILSRPIPENSKIVYVKIPSVSIADAVELSKSINRQESTASTTNQVQRRGRFIFDEAGLTDVGTAATPGTVNCYYYVGSF